MMENQARLNTDPRPSHLSIAWAAIKWRLYLISLRLFYRGFSRLIHRFGMHQMKRLEIEPRKPFYRCDWCGMHGTKVEFDPSHPGIIQ